MLAPPVLRHLEPLVQLLLRLVGDVVLVGDERNVSSLFLALRLDLTALPPSPLPAARTASIPNRREHLAQQRAVEDSWYACHAPESPEKNCSLRGSPAAAEAANCSGVKRFGMAVPQTRRRIQSLEPTKSMTSAPSTPVQARAGRAARTVPKKRR